MKLLLTIIIVSFGYTIYSQEKEQTFDEMVKSYYKNTVPLIYPHQLYRMIINGEKFNLLDTRETKEYEVSFINGAIRIGYNNFSPSKITSIDKSLKTIVYCTIGARSESIGEKLKKNGFNKVYNLYGGMIYWKNQGYPTYTSNKTKTNNVHVYSQEWGKWLKKGNAVY